MNIPWHTLLTIELTPEGIAAFVRRHEAKAAGADAPAPEAPADKSGDYAASSGSSTCAGGACN